MPSSPDRTSSAQRAADPVPDTREVIARRARELFDRQGYTATSVRSIAAAAGIDPALVIRYFGSKEELFVRVMDLVEQTGPVLDGPTETMGRRLVANTLAEERAELRRQFTAMLWASDRDRVRASLREAIHRLFVVQVARRLEGPDVLLRAELIAAQIAGLMQAVAITGSEDVTEADQSRIVELYGDAIQRLVDVPSSP